MDDEAVMALYERTVSDVHRYASRLCGGNRAATEELVQDAYLALVKHVRAHPDETVDLHWLIVDCRNRFVDRLPRYRTERVGRDAELTVLSPLPPDQRFALVLRYVDDLTLAQVAKALGRSTSTTEALLTKARATLRGASDPVVVDG